MLNKIKTYKVVTFGCQMNARDSEKIAGVLENKGYIYEESEEKADIVIFNTCTVRENANERLYGRIGQLKKSATINKNKIIGICGCMMQEKDEVIKIQEKYKYVKLIFGTFNLDNFSYLIDKVILNDKKVVEVLDKENGTENVLPSKRVYNYKCGINIMFGCNNFCTYCIVPYVRGRERSRDVKSIIDEIRNFVNDGVVEVMLLGQNVNSYRGIYNLNQEKKIYDFPMLLDEVCKIDGLKRVRFMTSHPKDFSDELISAIKNNNKVCRHIHLPVQSGSNKILKEMNRHYTVEHYLEIIDKLRTNLDDVSITTDIIVGFPGETDDDFEDTLKLIKKVSFDSVFTFEYSKRTGTKAAKFPNQVPIKIVKDRFVKLLDVVEKSACMNTKKYVGNNFEALVESEDKENGKLTARLSNNYLVYFVGDKSLIGKIVTVKLVKSHNFYFDGELVFKG